MLRNADRRACIALSYIAESKRRCPAKFRCWLHGLVSRVLRGEVELRDCLIVHDPVRKNDAVLYCWECWLYIAGKDPECLPCFALVFDCSCCCGIVY